jgi:hypothetical protein
VKEKQWFIFLAFPWIWLTTITLALMIEPVLPIYMIFYNFNPENFVYLDKYNDRTGGYMPLDGLPTLFA